MADYGVLGSVVSGAGWIIATSAALTLTWKGRARWEPAEEDVSRGPRKAAGLLAGIAIVLLWVFAKPASLASLLWLAGGLGIATLLSLLAYGYLIASTIYKREVPTSTPGQFIEEKVIGGFALTGPAKTRIQEQSITIQRLFAGSGYDPDLVWTRSSRALAKQCYALLYILVVVCGTVALGAASIALKVAPKEAPTHATSTYPSNP